MKLIVKRFAKLFCSLFSKCFGVISLKKDLQKDLLNTQIQQKQLQFYYQNLLVNNRPLPKLSNTGFRVYSQTNEDGILLYIFSLIGTTNKICFDVAFASPYGANTTNLIINSGWNGILICGSENEKENTERFFASHPDTNLFLPKIYHKWVTTDNINEIAEQGMKDFHLEERTIDLFSLDIDGVDYWIWKALEAVEPRVVVLEYHNVLGVKSLTVPYTADFNRFDKHPDYMGASLPAFVKLAKEKGYRLVCCNLHGYNAFFIKKGIAEDIIPKVSVKDCLNQPQAVDAHKNRYPEVSIYDWVDV